MFCSDTDRDTIKFPRIAHKSKSMPGNGRSQSSPQEAITAKAWFYVTPHSQYGSYYLI